jgi:hypothetical protein
LVAKNTGQTPALDLRSHIDKERWGPRGGRCGQRTHVESPYNSASPLGPGERTANNNLVVVLDQDCIDDLHRGAASFSVLGVFTYRDIFGTEHVTNYCARYEGLTTRLMTICEDHNELN